MRAALETAGILPEYFDGQRLVLMAGPYNTEADFAVLATALSPFGPGQDLPLSKKAPALPEMVCPPREAFFGEKERLATAAATGRVAAGLEVPCPPGVPLVAPGERLSKALCEALCAGGILEVDVLK